MRSLPSETGSVAEVYLRSLPCATLRAPGPRASLNGATEGLRHRRLPNASAGAPTRRSARRANR